MLAGIVLRIMRAYDRSIGLTGYVFSELTANVFWLVFCCGMLMISNQMYIPSMSILSLAAIIFRDSVIALN